MLTLLLSFMGLIVMGLGLFLIWVWRTPVWRQAHVIQPLSEYLEGNLPSISQIERETLEAGDSWWETDLFQASPTWEKMLVIPKPCLTDEEQAFLDNQVNTLCGLLHDWAIVHKNHDLPKNAWDYIKQEKFWGLTIPKSYGGLGFSHTLHSAAISKLASRSQSAALTIMVPNSLGPAELLMAYGTQEQKADYLPRLASGEAIPCFALTGIDAGSDATGMTDRGVITEGEYKGQIILGIRLNWKKRYITLAPIATLIGIAFYLYDPDKKCGEKEDLGITLALIPADHPGVHIGSRHEPMGLGFMNGPVSGDNVFIPFNWVIGGMTQAGKGWRMLVECLAVGRGISLPAVATAQAQVAFKTSSAYSALRYQFKCPIGQFEGVEEVLARIGGLTYLIEATRLFTLSAMAKGLRPSTATAIAKYHMTELGRILINDAMDIHGGRSIQLGPHNYLGLIYQAVPIGITVEGANILTRNLIIFGQGAVQSHPYLKAIMHAIRIHNPKERIQSLDSLFKQQVKLTLSNLFKGFWQGITQSYFIPIPASVRSEPCLKIYYQQVSRLTTILAVMSDSAFALLGGRFKRAERLSARLGDILSYTYLASAVLKYYHDQPDSNEERPYAYWALSYCLYQAQQAALQALTNFPNRYIGLCLKGWLFPLGAPYASPSDALSHTLAQHMQKPSKLRDRLTKLCYVGNKEDDPIYAIEKAFHALEAHTPLKEKWQKAVSEGIINPAQDFKTQVKHAKDAQIFTENEALAYEMFEKLRQDALKVDDF